MPHTPENLDDYQWPACTSCTKPLWISEIEDGRYACRPCEDKARTRLAALPGLFAELNRTATLMHGSRSPSAATSGSRVPPIPPRLDVLALTGPGGAAARLRDIEDAWRAALGWTIAPWRGSPAQAVPEHVRFLTNNLPWATGSYEEVGQDIDDIRRLHGEMTAAVTTERRPGRVKVGLCPAPAEEGTCGVQLTASSGKEQIRCPACGAAWIGKDGWDALRDEQQKALQRDAGVAA
ncbi:hypothetical protein [Streptomyces sp. CBMA152]|uniref:hypothetical protein n=1 Tax=Streptomyces sp. CBMA152 TaxID=1896312 RepID=UPI00166065BB|nr:hypothetical protein [Streptomyces sp. CBMA152]MBD0743580.1 hypothetical protein [Streptomyces sp. CBMA152]